MDIKFINLRGIDTEAIPAPTPASQHIPDWYKQISSWISGKKEPNPLTPLQANQTVKKCMPVFDAITAGYIITTPCDVWIKKDKETGESTFIWTAFDFIEFHSKRQTENHPATKYTEFDTPKFMNPWSIKTPKGYSCLFVTPSHQDVPFDILPGIVDTDTYNLAVNFPFKLKDNNFEGLIPAGTPMVQVIPFKRESWKMQVGTKKDLQTIYPLMDKMSTVFWDRYKRFWWNKKEYK